MIAVDEKENGITFCCGSLGVRENVDFESFIKRWGHRIHFAHLRNTRREGYSSDGRYSFYEAAHLEGDTNMVRVVNALLAAEQQRKDAGEPEWQLPMRPDHGQELLTDLEAHSMPGYPLIGRMRGLAELRGIMTAFADVAD